MLRKTTPTKTKYKDLFPSQKFWILASEIICPRKNPGNVALSQENKYIQTKGDGERVKDTAESQKMNLASINSRIYDTFP
jgi:hypothetical protein